MLWYNLYDSSSVVYTRARRRTAHPRVVTLALDSRRTQTVALARGLGQANAVVVDYDVRDSARRGPRSLEALAEGDDVDHDGVGPRLGALVVGQRAAHGLPLLVLDEPGAQRVVDELAELLVHKVLSRTVFQN